MTSLPVDPSSFRYIVDDVASAVTFYTAQLGFVITMQRPDFAQLTGHGMRLLLSSSSGGGGAAQPLQDGTTPRPGGWNRIQFLVEDLDAALAALRASGVPCRSDVISGRGGRQLLVQDPAGNLVELFEPWPDRAE
ncbi:VOC family protein [Kribbella sp. NPDC023855]|uniref:VOC family protein n=1 Tax=Kribbella sp. NPDC023855 TaxID=3154698 RepID=UPI0034029AC8